MSQAAWETQPMHCLAVLVVLVACGLSAVTVAKRCRNSPMLRARLGDAVAPAQGLASLCSHALTAWACSVKSLALQAYGDCEHSPQALDVAGEHRTPAAVAASEAVAPARSESPSVGKPAHDGISASDMQRPVAPAASGVRAAVKAIETAMAANPGAPTPQPAGNAASRRQRAPRKPAAGQVSPDWMQRNTKTGAEVTRPLIDKEAVSVAGEPVGLELLAKAKLALRAPSSAYAESGAAPRLPGTAAAHRGPAASPASEAVVSARLEPQGVRAAVKAIERAMAVNGGAPTPQPAGTAARRWQRAPGETAAGQVAPYCMQRNTTTGAGVPRPLTNKAVDVAGEPAGLELVAKALRASPGTATAHRSPSASPASAAVASARSGPLGVRAAVKAIEQALAANGGAPTPKPAASRRQRAPGEAAAGQCMQRNATAGGRVTGKEVEAACMAITAN